MVASKRPITREARKAVPRLMPEPERAVARALPGGREEVLLAAKARAVQRLELRFAPAEVHHRVDGEAAHQLAALVHHRRRHQVVALEGLRRLAGGIVGREGHRRRRTHARHGQVGRAGEKRLQGEHAPQARCARPPRTRRRSAAAGRPVPAARRSPRRTCGSSRTVTVSWLMSWPTEPAREGGLHPRPVLRAQIAGRLLQQLRLQRVGEEGEVVGVELPQDLQQRGPGRCSEQRLPHARGHLDQRLARLARRHLRPDLKALPHGRALRG